MVRPRIAFLPGIFAISLCSSVSAQTVISTHSGILYFFEGAVYVGDQRMEQRFGKFPDIGEGNELRTDQGGRAEVLLTPGVFLRLSENSAIRMVSEQLSDTRVELLNGSAIMEVNQNAPNTSVTLSYKQWQVRTPDAGVYRIDSDPARIRVYRGQTNVSTDAKSDPVTVKDNEDLPLSAVLVPEPAPIAGGDGFKAWAMNRSQAVSADNAIASEILDDPNQMDTGGVTLDAGGYTYFPMTGVPSLGISNPYGVSFWSPYQASLNALYFPSYLYTPFYPGWPTGIVVYPRPSVLVPGRLGTLGLRPGLLTPRPIGGTSRPSYVPSVVRPGVVRPAIAPHPVVGHR